MADGMAGDRTEHPGPEGATMCPPSLMSGIASGTSSLMRDTSSAEEL